MSDCGQVKYTSRRWARRVSGWCSCLPARACAQASSYNEFASSLSLRSMINKYRDNADNKFFTLCIDPINLIHYLVTKVFNGYSRSLQLRASP